MNSCANCIKKDVCKIKKDRENLEKLVTKSSLNTLGIFEPIINCKAYINDFDFF